jgi:hypothetical protein
MTNIKDVRHENSYFTTRVIISEDRMLFISVDPSDPERLSILGTGARILFALSKSASSEEAQKLSDLINQLGHQLLIIVDNSHPLFSSPTCAPSVYH